MNIQQHAGFYIAGLTARTNNAHEISGKGKIGNVWQEFLKPNVVAKIPNKMGVDLIAVYTDYETDHTGHYTYLLGLPILSAESQPANLTVKHIPAGCYAVFSSSRGPIADRPGDMAAHLVHVPGRTRRHPRIQDRLRDLRPARRRSGKRPDRHLHRPPLTAFPYPASTDFTPRIDRQNRTQRPQS